MAIAPSTHRNYSSAWQAYKTFCRHINRTTLPPAQSILILFATHLASFSSYSNIKRHISAITHFSTLHGHDAQIHTFHRLYLLIRGIKRSQGSSRSLPKRLPITPNILHTIRLNLFRSQRLYEDKTLLWAAILTAFFGFLRVSEYTSTHKTKFDPDTTLLMSDVQISDSAATLHIKASKTDPFRQGIHIRIAANDTQLCPVNALKLFLNTRKQIDGPLFTYTNNKYLTRADVNKTLSTFTNGAADISSHSLRIGAASTAAAMGCPKWLIQGMGRWTSDCYRRYIHITDDTIMSTSRALARCNFSNLEHFNPHT